MKKVGTHQTLPLVNTMSVSPELLRDAGMVEYVRERLTGPRIDRWLVLRPVGDPEIVYAETGDDWMRNTVTVLASGTWDAVFIGRGRRH